MALPIFAVTLFVSAFLLFLVQPMIGKMILPSLGGTPQVWNTCMVFFQTALLAGYAYTHTVSTRMKLRTQLLMQGLVLLAPFALFAGYMLAYGPQGGTFRGLTSGWIPLAGGNPIFDTLWKLTIVVGLPFFVVSTSAPLLQKWFVHTGHPAAKDPYFLYGASNLGSMLSLVAYPFLIEWTLGLYAQSWTWVVGYVVMVALYIVCVGLVWNAPPLVELSRDREGAEGTKVAEEAIKEDKKEEPKETGIKAGPPAKSESVASRIRKGSKQRRRKKKAGGMQPAEKRTAPRSVRVPDRQQYEEVRSDVMTPWRRIRWILLAFVPSSMMLGITTYISTDVSAIPLFWVIPLALYLLSFILVFLKWPIVWTREPHTLMVMAHPVVALCFVFLLLTGEVAPIYRSIGFSIFAFFVTAMVCHGELARDRPSTKHLTEFYLMLSVGGMLGGVFNALFAPYFFWGLAELPIAIAVACILRPQVRRMFPLERTVMVIFCSILGLICGALLRPVPLGNVDPIIVGAALGGVLGGLAGAIFTFDRQSLGWTEQALFALLPDFGTWVDNKGKEIKSELQKSGNEDERAQSEDEEKPKRKRSIAAVAPPDYYLLNYALDVSLPVLVVLLMYVALVNDDWIWKQFLELGKSLSVDQRNMRDFVLGGLNAIRFGVPLVFALIFSFRPVRFGVLIGLVFLISGFHAWKQEGDGILTRTRSYFGVLRVLYEQEGRNAAPIGASEAEEINNNLPVGSSSKVKIGSFTPYTYLMHGTTHHGLNYQSPKQIRRLATTYYHRKGPVGVIMERLNWFPGPQNTYWADGRMPAALAGMGAGPLNFGLIPDVQMVNLWSEPPYCCIGLGTGTMASYARPLQHMTFYEIDEKIRQFSLDNKIKLPAKLFVGDSLKAKARTGPYYNYLRDAIDRGANIEIMMGDARISMKPRTERLREEQRRKGEFGDWKKTREGIAYQKRQHYYHTMEIDAFSSDAIPVHLITEEAIQQYLDELAPEGVIMVHTSNRHVDLPRPVMDIAVALNLDYRVVNCMGESSGGVGSKSRGHFQSEYVMLSRKFIEIARLYAERNGEDVKALSESGELQQRADELQKTAKDRWQSRLKQLLTNKTMSEELRSEIKKVWDRTTCIPDQTTEPLGAAGVYQVWDVPSPPNSRLWTDDYSNMMSVFRWGFGH